MENNSNIKVGQMFVQFPKPIADNQEKPTARVWVKTGPSDYVSEVPISVFVDNNVLTKWKTGAMKKIGIRDKWNISDNYYNSCVENGDFVPIESLTEVDAVCRKKGYLPPEIPLQ